MKPLLPGLLGWLVALPLGACGKEAKAPKKAPAVAAAKAGASRPAKVTAKRTLSPPPVLQKAKASAQVEPEKEAPANALEAFEAELDGVADTLTPFFEGEKDPRAHLEELQTTYRTLDPLDEFLSYHSARHRDQIPEATRLTLQKFRASITSLNYLLLANDSPSEQELQTLIGHTLDNIKDIEPVLQELEPPREPS